MGFHSSVYDAGLQHIIDNTDALHICNAEPTNHTEATATFSLADRVPTFGTISAGTGSDRQVDTQAFSGETVDTSGTGNWVALVDNTNNIVLATAPIASPQALTAGNPFNLGAITWTSGPRA